MNMGVVSLVVLIIGLLCYGVIQLAYYFQDKENKENEVNDD